MVFLLNQTLRLQVRFLGACLFLAVRSEDECSFVCDALRHTRPYFFTHEQPLLDKVCVQRVSDTSGEKVQSVADRYEQYCTLSTPTGHCALEGVNSPEAFNIFGVD